MIQNKPHKIEVLLFLVALAIVVAGLYYLGPSITSFVIKEFSYIDKPNLVITSNGNYTWNIENGELKYIKLDGSITIYGKARVYIENNGIKYLVFDSTRLNESITNNLITGFVVKDEESDKDKKKKNNKPDWTSGIDTFIINGTTKINLSQHFTDLDGDALIYSASEVEGLEITISNEIATIKPIAEQEFNTKITFTASDGIYTKNEIVDLIVIVEKKENKAPVWISSIDTFIINGTTTINLSQYFIDENNDALIYSTGLVDNITITIDDEVITLIPADSYFGSASTIFSAFDGKNLTIKNVNLIIPERIVINATEPLNETINITPKINNAPEWVSDINSFILNKTLSIDLLHYFVDEDNDTLSFNVSDAVDISESISANILTLTTTLDNFNTTIAITASDGNLSASKEVRLIIPLTPAIITKTISISLAYKSGTIYDANDNGEESVNGIADLTVEETRFNWDVDKSKLCTRWEIYNVEEETLTTFCNGNSDCCAFAGLLPSKENWDEVYYSTFGKDNAGYSNIVSAQVLYYDVNLSIENTKSEIYYSEWGNLSVKFFEEELQFFDFCLETCALSGLNKSSYNLIFEIEDDAVLRINKIKYSLLVDVVNNPPLLLQNFSTINIVNNKNATINLSQYFADPDGDILSYNYYKADNIAILFENDSAVIVTDKDIDGLRFTYLIANDSENFVASNVFAINISEEKMQLKFFEIRDNADRKLAVFDNFGNVNIKGALIQNTEPIADENDFVIQDTFGNLSAVITNPEGDMLLKGALNENQVLLVPTSNSFTIQNKNNETVAYFNSTGSLFLKGTLTENVLFEWKIKNNKEQWLQMDKYVNLIYFKFFITQKFIFIMQIFNISRNLKNITHSK